MLTHVTVNSLLILYPSTKKNNNKRLMSTKAKFKARSLMSYTKEALHSDEKIGLKEEVTVQYF